MQKHVKAYALMLVTFAILLIIVNFTGASIQALTLLCVIWFVCFSVGLYKYRRAFNEDIHDRTVWLLVGGDLRMTLRPSQRATDETTILCVGPGFQEALGWEPEEMIDKDCRAFCHPDDWNLTSIQVLNQRQEYTTRWRHKEDTLDGQPRWVWLEWNTVRDGLIYANARNITDRFDQEAKMAVWSRITTDFLIITDTRIPVLERKPEWLNEAWAKQLGWSLQEIYDMPLVSLLEPTKAPEIIAGRFRKESGQPNMLEVSEYQVRCKTIPGKPPEYRTYEWTSLVLDNMLYMTGRDIGQERLYQEEVSRAIIDLEARNADLERFASLTAHQLRSPPRTIAGIAIALQEDYGHLLDEDGTLFLQDILNDANQMAEIVDGLYRFSKVRTATDLVLEPVDLGGLMEEVVSSSNKKDYYRPQDQLVWKDLPSVMGDRVLLLEVLRNLVDNGFKFNESEIKTVTVSAQQMPNKRWAITVTDNGVGIDTQYQAKVFLIFQRVHPKYTGTGVGLALVEAIIQKLGGEISLHSQEGLGSSFTFDLDPGYDTKTTVDLTPTEM